VAQVDHLKEADSRGDHNGRQGGVRQILEEVGRRSSTDR